MLDRNLMKPTDDLTVEQAFRFRHLKESDWTRFHRLM